MTDLKADTMVGNLTEKEAYFLEVLFDRCQGDIVCALDLAGMTKEMSPSAARRKFKEQIAEASKDYLSAFSGKAAIQMVSILNDPTAPGSKQTLAAAKEILDRGGVFKDPTPSTITENNVFILPAKDPQDIDSKDSIDETE